MSLKLDYVSRETVSNLRRNLLLTTASMLTVGVSLAMVGFAFFVRVGVDNATARWKNGIEFEVFMIPAASDGQTDAVESKLRSNPQVRSVTFIDREEQYKLYKQFYADEPETLSVTRVEDMPQSFRVVPRAKDTELIRSIADSVGKSAGVKDVAFAQDAVDRALRTSRALQIAVIAIAATLFVASALLIFNTIRMAIFARRREIEVMKLVGATNWFIRVPFMLEGLAQGLVGALVSFGALYSFRTFLRRWIVDNFADFDGFFVANSEALIIGLLVVFVGAAVGAVSAGVAVTRFLDV
jgi:cell division transport system permease protein